MRKYLIILFFTLITKFSFGQDVITYEVNGKYGLKDSIGNIITPPMYDYINFFSEGFAYVIISRNGIEKYGFIDTNGIVIIPVKYDNVNSFWEGRAVVARKINRKEIDDRTGEKVKIIDYKYGVINTKGKKITPLKYYDRVHCFVNGETAVMKKDKWGLYDKSGKKNLPIMYEGISTFPSEGLYGVRLNEKWGFVNAKNQLIIPHHFFYIDTEGGFKDGKIYVKEFEYGKGGYYIDKNGKKIP